MKDILITPKQLKKELLYWFLSLAMAVLLNIYSIIKYQTSWLEMVTQAGYVLVLSLVIYLILALGRILVIVIKKAV